MDLPTTLKLAWVRKLNKVLGLDNSSREKTYTVADFKQRISRISSQFNELITIFDLANKVKLDEGDIVTSGVQILNKVYHRWGGTNVIKEGDIIKKTGSNLWEIIRDDRTPEVKAQMESETEADIDRQLTYFTALYFSQLGSQFIESDSDEFPSDDDDSVNPLNPKEMEDYVKRQLPVHLKKRFT